MGDIATLPEAFSTPSSPNGPRLVPHPKQAVLRVPRGFRAFSGDAFVTFHGSWNRSLRTGYKLVRVPMRDGRPTGVYEDFVTVFIVDDGNVWGTPVATVELGDGSLLLSDDATPSGALPTLADCRG